MAQLEKQQGPEQASRAQSEISLQAPPRVEPQAARTILIPAGDRPVKDLDHLGVVAMQLAARTGCEVIFSWDGEHYFAADKDGIKETSYAGAA